MTPAEQDRAFKAAVKLAAGERGAIQNATADEVTRLLKEAAARIQTALEGQPSDYLAWYWPQLRREIEATLREFGEAAGTAATEGQARAWTAGQALVERPLTAADLGGVVARLPGLDTRPLLAMQLFLTGKMKDVGLDTVNRVNGELALTMIGAQGVGATITRIQEVMGGVSRRRAVTIVRTELGRAFAAASQQRSEQAAEYVPELRKQWRRSGKIHSRLKHDLTDGQVRPVKEPFILGTGHVSDPATHGGIRIMYPHDPAAPPAETINCGCISLPYMASWAGSGALTDPGKRPFSEREIALNPVKQELAGPGLTIGEIVDAQRLGPPAFIGKARTVAGAERAARKLGLKSAHYAEHLDIGNEVNHALKLLADRGLPMPDHVRIDASLFARWHAQSGVVTKEPAAFTMDKRSGETYLMLNPDDDYWGHPRLIAEHQRQIGEWSTGHQYHPLIHEIGHAAHFKSAPTLYANLANYPLTPQEAQIAATVSRYATYDAKEFVAETFSVLATGGMVDAVALSLYRALGGPMP